MAKKKKYYVVWEGNETGVFDSWAKCLLHTKGYPNAKYKAFKDKEEAYEAFYAGTYSNFAQSKKTTKTIVSEESRKEIVWKSMSVDAACSGNPGVMEYQGVDTETGEQFFYKKFPMGTNNVGEFLAIVHALAVLKKDGKNTPIYSDSRNAMLWVNKCKCNSKLVKNARTKTLWTVITRAEKWLKTNDWDNQLLKWETKKWGEIPADFGRK